eukprot:5433859-Heterocapsa_arctica.AAC.1
MSCGDALDGEAMRPRWRREEAKLDDALDEEMAARRALRARGGRTPSSWKHSCKRWQQDKKKNAPWKKIATTSHPWRSAADL